MLKSTDGFAEHGLVFGSDPKALARSVIGMQPLVPGHGWLLQPYSAHLRAKEHRVFLRPRSADIWIVLVTAAHGDGLYCWLLDDVPSGDETKRLLQAFVHKLVAAVPEVANRIQTGYQNRFDCFIDSGKVLLNEVTCGIDCSVFLDWRAPRDNVLNQSWMFECLTSSFTMLVLGMAFVNEQYKGAPQAGPRRDRVRLMRLQSLYPEAKIISFNNNQQRGECSPHLHYQGEWSQRCASSLLEDETLSPHLKSGCRFLLLDYIRFPGAYERDMYDVLWKETFERLLLSKIIVPQVTETFAAPNSSVENLLEELSGRLRAAGHDLLYELVDGRCNPLFRASCQVDADPSFAATTHEREQKFFRIVVRNT